MATKFKTPAKFDLGAIHRLEFYKKQRNWKFCKDICANPDLKTKPDSEVPPEPAETPGTK